MATALDVARCLIRLAANEEEPDPLTHLRLQKLLYYAQGWSLAQRGRPLFDDRIEAWAHGPVVPSVYHAYRARGWTSIFPDEEESPNPLSDEEQDYIASVWEAFKGYSATSLRQMTHTEDPWRDVREGFGPADRCETEIPLEALRSYFSQVD